MGIKRLSVWAFALLITVACNAQEKIVVSGVEYIVHKVERKQTLYAISKIYSVSLQDILNANPSTKSGINTGQRLLIPKASMNKKASKNAPVLEDGKLKHRVKRKETWYSISKKYNVELPDLLEENPHLGAGLKEGAMVSIPQAKVADSPNWSVASATEKQGRFHTVKQGETLYSISKLYELEVEEIKSLNHLSSNDLSLGVQLRLPEVQIETESSEALSVVPNLKESYKLGFFLPFSVDRNDSVYVEKGGNRIYPLTDIALQFYFGAQMALDTLEALGLNADVVFKDMTADISETSVNEFRTEIEEMDLVIGPFHKKPVELVAAITQAETIPHVCPVTTSNRVVMGRTELYKAKSGRIDQLEAITSFAATNKSEGNVIIFMPDNEKEKDLQELALAKLKEKMPSIEIHVVEDASDPEKFRVHFQLDKLNAVLIPSEDQSIVSGLLTKLNGIADKHPMVVYGFEKWADFDNIDLAYKDKLNVHLAMSNWIDRTNPDVKNFVSNFRAEHNNDASEFAFIGYDVTLYFGTQLLLKGKDFKNYINQGPKSQTLQMEFDFKSTGILNGMRNTGIIMVGHEKGSLVRLVDVSPNSAGPY